MPSSFLNKRPTEKEFATAYLGYVSLVPDGDLVKSLEQQRSDSQSLLRALSEDKSQHRYQPDKWSIREVVGHVVDSERVFMYRALTFARADDTPLPGYDENKWGAASNAHGRTLASHLDEMQAVRASTVALLSGFSDAEAERWGKANNKTFSVRALAWIVAGHERHHIKILKERYL